MDKITLTQEEMIIRGELLAEMMILKRSKAYPERYRTAWGTKTALGLFLSCARIINEGNSRV